VRSPDSTVLSRRCDSLTPVSLHFVAFDPRYHCSTRPSFRSRRHRVLSMRRAWSLLTRQLRPGIMRVETSGPPKFPWSLLCPFAHVHATPAGRAFLTICETHVLPPLIQLRGLRRQYCRGSIAWLSNSLSTLRGAGCPYPTQDSLPAAGQALPDRTFTRKGSAERFQSQLLINIPLSRASWRNERLRNSAERRNKCHSALEDSQVGLDKGISSTKGPTRSIGQSGRVRRSRSVCVTERRIRRTCQRLTAQTSLR